MLLNTFNIISKGLICLSESKIPRITDNEDKYKPVPMVTANIGIGNRSLLAQGILGVLPLEIETKRFERRYL